MVWTPQPDRLSAMSRTLTQAWAVATAAAIFVMGQIVLSGASPVPVGDESAHLGKLFELQVMLSQSQGWLESFNRLAITGDAYPNTIYALTLPFLGGEPSIDDARQALLWLPTLHAWIAVTVGSRLWGRPAALAYVVLACLSPIVMAYQPVYLLDTALLSAVGISVILCESTDGFRRPVMTACFVLAAALTLLTKWTALLWLSAPTAWQCWRAVASGPASFTLKAQRAALMLGVSAIGVTLIFNISGTEWAQGWRPEDAGAWGPLLFLLCALAGTIGLSSRIWSPYRRAMIALVAVLVLAGAWYAMRMPLLLERMAHEATTGIPQSGPNANHLTMWTQTLRMLVQGGELWLVLGLVLATWRRTGPTWARALGLALGVGVTIRYLPFNPRYLLPVAPLLAGIAVGAWSHWSSRIQWGAAAMTASLVTLIALAPLPTEPLTQTWTTERVRLPYPELSKGVGTPPAPLDRPSTAAMLDTLSVFCERGCQAHLTDRPHGIQGRAIRVLGMTRGLDVRFSGPCGGPEVPLPGTDQTLTVCDPGP